jgi:Mrp family chromosome partitioning ATPase
MRKSILVMSGKGGVGKTTIDFCNQMKISLLGVVENMSGGIFGSGSVSKKCQEENLPLEDDSELITDFEKITTTIIGGFKK